MPEERACLNCGTRLLDRYCPSCGQDSRDPPQDVPSLVGDVLARLAGLESRGLRSLGALFFKPGRLTRAFLEGRRVRYSTPVQLYLWCTAAFFLTQALFPLVRLDTDTGAVESSLSAVNVGTALSPETLRRLSEQGTSIAVFAERFDAAVTAYFPLLLVGLVGVSAILMWVQFRREPALKHIVFALHWTAFYFALEIVRQVLPRLGSWGTPVSVFAYFLGLWYLYVAMRVVYERGRVGTALRAFTTIILFAVLLAGWLWSTIALAERIA